MVSDCSDLTVWCPPQNWTGSWPDVFISFDTDDFNNTVDGKVCFLNSNHFDYVMNWMISVFDKGGA